MKTIKQKKNQKISNFQVSYHTKKIKETPTFAGVSRKQISKDSYFHGHYQTKKSNLRLCYHKKILILGRRFTQKKKKKKMKSSSLLSHEKFQFESIGPHTKKITFV